MRRLKKSLPDVLRGQLPDLSNFLFLSSTESGSFRESEELKKVINSADFNLILGDLSRNSITSKAVTSACKDSEKPVIITRDAIDLISENITESGLMNENLIFFASMPQLIKILRAVTLSNEQILVAKNGEVKAVPILESGFSPIMFWQGEMAAKILAFNLYNPNNFIKATISAIFS